MPVWFQWVVGLIGTGGLGKLLWDVTQVFTGRGKRKAESAVMLVNSATEYADKLDKRLDSINARFDEFRHEQEQRNKANDRRWREQDQLLIAHARWDHQVASALRAKGARVEEPPPLWLTPEGTS